MWKNIEITLIVLYATLGFCIPGIAQSSIDRASVSKIIAAKHTDTAAVLELYQLGDSIVNSRNGLKVDITSVNYIVGQMFRLSKDANYPAGTAMGHLLQAKAYRVAGNAAAGRPFCEQAIKGFAQTGRQRLEAEAMIELGGSYSNESDELPVKISWYRKGIALIDTSQETLKIAELKEFFGDLLQYSGDYKAAVPELTQSICLYKKVGYQRLHGVYSLLGECYYRLDIFGESLRYHLLAMKVAEQQKEVGPLMVAIYNRVGNMYFDATYYDRSVEYYEKSIALAKSLHDTADLAWVLINSSKAMMLAGKYRESLATLAVANKFAGTFDNAETYYTAAIAQKDYIGLNELTQVVNTGAALQALLRKPELDKNVREWILGELINNYQALGKFKEAVPLLEEYAKEIKEVPVSIQWRLTYQHQLFRSDSAQGKFKEAMEHHIQFKKIADTIHKLREVKQLAALQLQFETEQKDNNIQVLTQKAQLQEASLQREKVLRGLFISGGCMLLVVLTVLFNRYRLKERTNLALENKQQEINYQNVELKKLVHDKEWLLKEVHHRVKNNLQIVISLLNTQSQFLQNDDAITAIRTSQNRMHAMSLIHQQLYQDKEPGKIDMQWYIKSLVEYVKQAFHTGGRIVFILTSDKVLLDVVQAVPLGLIINEAVSNSIKYAFPCQQQGTIHVGIKEIDKNEYVLVVSDDGVGIKSDKRINESDSLGISLMRGLADQLDGQFNMETGSAGVGITVSFSVTEIESHLSNTL